MSEYYRHRLRQLQKLLEPGLWRMLLLSFVLHLIVPIILSGVLKITHRSPPPMPVYRVNLVNKPVKDPRAGRSDATPGKKKSVTPQPEAKKIPAKTIKPEKPKPVEKKVVPKKIAKPEVKPDKSAEKARNDILAEMKAKAEREKAFAELKAKIAALGKPEVDAPVGDPEGTGKDIGISSIRMIESIITNNWRLSQYQLPNLDLQAEVKILYSAEGKMRNWDFVEKSGNVLFDDSLQRAILKSRDLGDTLPESGEFEIIFNLKDLQNR